MGQPHFGKNKNKFVFVSWVTRFHLRSRDFHSGSRHFHLGSRDFHLGSRDLHSGSRDFHSGSRELVSTSWGAQKCPILPQTIARKGKFSLSRTQNPDGWRHALPGNCLGTKWGHFWAPTILKPGLSFRPHSKTIGSSESEANWGLLTR